MSLLLKGLYIYLFSQIHYLTNRNTYIVSRNTRDREIRKKSHNLSAKDDIFPLISNHVYLRKVRRYTPHSKITLKK